MLDGIDGTGIRAGIYGEIGTSDPIRPSGKKCLQATAIAFEKKRAEVQVHTFPWAQAGLEASRLLIDGGVDPGKIVICHTVIEFDVPYIVSLLRLGVNIEFDNFGKEFFILKEDRGFAGGVFARDIERVRLTVGVGCLYLVRMVPAYALPVALLSFCLSFAGVASFLFGTAGVRALLPAIVGILLLGILAGLAPSLDWPLRGWGARLGHYFMQHLGIDVNVAIDLGQPPHGPAQATKLLLAVRGRIFEVAAECNGFGLLTSSLLLAVILGFHYRLTGLDRLLLLVTAVPVAIVFNALRIVGICVATSRTTLPYDLIHETVGVIFYVAAMALLWWLARRQAEPGLVEDAKVEV